MKKTSVRTAVLYSASGGFLTILFGLLGAAAAQAAPKADNDAHMRDVNAVAEQNRKDRAAAEPAPAAQPARQQQQQPRQEPRQADREQGDRETRKFERQANESEEEKEESRKADDRETRKFENQAAESREEKEESRKADDRETRKFENQAAESEKQRDRERAEESRQADDRETRKFEREAQQARKADDDQEQDDRETRKFQREINEDKERRSEDISVVAEQNRQDRARDESLRDYMRGTYAATDQNREDRAADERKKLPPVRGQRAIEVDQEIQRTAGPARIEADRWAKLRDQGVTGSVRAYETTERFAAEAAADAQWRERLRDVGKPKPTPVGRYPKTIELDEPISGLRALEVKDEIDRTAELVAKDAKTLKEYADTRPDGPDKDNAVQAAKDVGREARRLEYLRDAGMPALGKGLRDTGDSIVEDVTSATKEAAAVGGIVTDALVGRKNSQLEGEIKASRDETTRAFRDYVAASKVRNADGSVSPAQAELVRQRLAEATAAADRHQRVVSPVQRAGKLVNAVGKLGGAAWDGAGVYIDIKEGKTPGEVASGAVGGVVGSLLGKRFGPPGVWAGGFAGSALGENLFKRVRDSDKDINEFVNEE